MIRTLIRGIFLSINSSFGMIISFYNYICSVIHHPFVLFKWWWTPVHYYFFSFFDKFWKTFCSANQFQITRASFQSEVFSKYQFIDICAFHKQLLIFLQLTIWFLREKRFGGEIWQRSLVFSPIKPWKVSQKYHSLWYMLDCICNFWKLIKLSQLESLNIKCSHFCKFVHCCRICSRFS